MPDTPAASLTRDVESELRAAFAPSALPAPDADRLEAGVREALRQLDALAGRFRDAGAANSLDALMVHAAGAVLAAEGAAHALLEAIRELNALRGSAGRIEHAVRGALGQALFRTGVVSMPVDELHEVAAAETPGRCQVDDPAALPARFWRQVEPEVDKAALGRALRLGPVPGAALVRDRTVRIGRRDNRTWSEAARA